MSQIYKRTTSGGLPPAVPTSFVTDVNSPSVPVANIENVLGGQTSVNNTNGVQTDGSSGGNTLTVQLTNRVSASVTTTDATPTQLYSFALSASPGTYLFDQKIVAYNVTDSLSAAYKGARALRTTGAAAVEIDNTPVSLLESEEGAMSAVLASNSVAANNAVLTVTGIVGKTIHWYVLTDYIFTT